MKRSFLLPFAFVSGLLLSACGTRSSLTDPDADPGCVPWSTSDGRAGAEHLLWAPFAVLDDGSVVVAIQDRVDGTGGMGMGSSNAYSVQKIDPEGETAWETMAGPEVQWIPAVARGAADEPLVLGAMNAGAQSALGATLPCPADGACSFLGKLAETGAPAWSKIVSASGVSLARALAVTGDGRMTVEGTFQGTLDLGCGPMTGGLDSRYLARLSPAGECLWSQAIVGTPRLEGVDDLAVDDDGEVALTLRLLSAPGARTIDLGGGPVPFVTEKSQALVVAKYAPNGDLVFARAVSGTSAQDSLIIHEANVALTDAGEVLVSTGYEGVLDLGGGPRGAPGLVRQFVTKLSATGEELWTRDVAASPLQEVGWLRPPFPLAVLPGGGFFLAGPGLPGLTILGKPAPEKAVFVAAYDAAGEPVSVQTFPVTEHATVAGLRASADGALVLAGSFAGTFDLGQEPLVSEGLQDSFVARICR